jgi:selenocysteine lyase/cysteine desulfurase
MFGQNSQMNSNFNFYNALDCQASLFNIPEHVCYLNSAYMGPLPNATALAGKNAIDLRACPTAITPPDFFQPADRVRKKLAQLVNADAESIAFIPTAAYGIATVAKNINPRAGQNIVILGEQFPSNVYSWRAMQQTGVQIRTVAKPNGAQGGAAQWSQAVIAAMDKDTVLVAIESAHWTDGTLFDLKKIGDAARRLNAFFLVDATQTVGAYPLDFKSMSVDALVVHSYKSMLSNYGLGFAVFSERMQNAQPIEHSWLLRHGAEDFSRLIDYQDEFAPGMRRFDTSTRANPILLMMLESSCDLLLSCGAQRICDYTQSIASEFIERARRCGYSVASQQERAGNIFGIRPPQGTDLDQIRARLALDKIYVSVRGSAIRISPHIYNKETDFQRLGMALGLT